MEVKPGTIPDGWKFAPLGQLCGRITTGKLDANAMVADGDYPFFTCARESYRINKYAFDCEALLVSGNGANVGYVHYYKGRFNAYQRTYVISDFSADVHFLKLFLDRNVRDRIRVEVNAGNTPYITMGTLTEMGVVLPSNPIEQRAIATALSAVDVLLSALDRLIAKKRDLKQAAMQQLLTGQTRLPGFHGEWEVKRLGELATIKDGTHQTPRYVQAGVPFYSVEHVTSGDFTNTKFISEEEHKFLTRTAKIEKGDILMTRIGSIGDCKLIDWDVDASFYVSLALLKIRSRYSAAFISHYSNTAAFKKEVELHSLRSAIPMKINLGPISNVKIELPPTLAEQTAIAEVLTDMDAELAALEQRREKTRALKQAMMQELLTGRTRLV